jgi:hypothetical protein
MPAHSSKNIDRKLVTTPHVLSQVSDLTDLHGKDLTAVRRLFGLLVEKMEEHYDTSKAVIADTVFFAGPTP